MLKKTAMVLVVCTCASVAFGAAVKIRGFINVNESNPDADAMCILNYVANQNKTIVQLMVSDFTPDTTYDIRHMNGTLQKADLLAFTTNQHGHGNYHAEVPGNVSTWDVELYIGLGSANDLRAVGINTQ